MPEEPLAQFDSSFPNGLYPTPNHLGSSTSLTGPAGYVQSWYYYQPFGQTTQSNGGMLGENPFRFTGREDDADGLYFYRDRYYSPDLGRFISEDPAGLDGLGNQYAYAGNNPVNYIDPFGDESLEAWFRQPGPLGGAPGFDHVTIVLRDDGPKGTGKVYYWAGYARNALFPFGFLTIHSGALHGSDEEKSLKSNNAVKKTIFSDPNRSFRHDVDMLEAAKELINKRLHIDYDPLPTDLVSPPTRNSNSAASSALHQQLGVDLKRSGLGKDPRGNCRPGWNLVINLHQPK